MNLSTLYKVLTLSLPVHSDLLKMDLSTFQMFLYLGSSIVVNIIKSLHRTVVLDVFSVPFLEKCHHICFLPCFRDAPFCYALCGQLG